MPNKITEINNLTKSTTISIAGTNKVAQTELDKFVVSPGGDQVVGTALLPATMPAAFATATDNIQVTWTDDATKTHRAVGGKLSVAGTTATISNLVDVSQYNVGLTGELAIGPTDATAALVSVSIGNLNPARDWIIDFSDKTNGAKGSEIKLQALIDWIREKNKDQGTEIALPDIKKSGEQEAKKIDPKDFTIVFNSFYFNITQKTFDFWVSSKAGESITFGDFTINRVGFRVTNVPVALPAAGDKKKALPEPDKEVAPPA